MAPAPKGEPPVVTGISPKEGIPGTQLTIRGENLGINQHDLIGLAICGIDCLLSARWESSRKIIARVVQPKTGFGDVIVTTRSGGRGTSTVQFRVFNVQVGPLQESAVWVDESRTVPALQREAGTTASLVDDDILALPEVKDRKFADSSIAELFPDGSGNVRLENFVPVWFLLENHGTASFENLKTGLANMQNQSPVGNREGPRDFLKTNLNSFVHCVEALAQVNDRLVNDRNVKGWPLGRKLEVQVNDCAIQANKLFADVLSRKERADSARNALSVLQRFKFLFFLPTTIDKHLDKGDYSVILNDYTRAKSLFAETDVPLFKEAYTQVEQRVVNFKKTLKERLSEMPSTFEDQKKIIRYLLLLEPDSDAGWTCLSAHYHWLMGLFWDSQTKHYKLAMQACRSNEADSDTDEKFAAEIPHRFHFVDSVASILSGKLQHFFKLGHAYVHGHLSSGPNLHKEEQFEEMILTIIQLGTWLVMNTILPETVPAGVSEQYKTRFVSWPDEERSDTMNLLQSLKTFRTCVASLLQQDISAKQLQPLYDLCIMLRVNCLARVVEQARQGVIDLQHRENWKIIAREKEFSKTNLPDLFERIVNEVLPLLKQIVVNGGFPSETDLFANEKLRGSVLFHFERLLCSFKECLEKISRISVGGHIDSASNRPTKLLLNSSEGKTTSKEGPIKDRKLLIVLSNCDYALRFSLPQCAERTKSISARFAEQLKERCVPSYGNLRTLLLKTYIGAKCSPFGELVEPVDKEDRSEIVEDVSNSIKDLVLCIVSVQAELYLVSPQFMNQVMSFVVRNCSEQLLSADKKTKIVSNEGNQVVLDLTAFEESVRYYLSNDTKKLLDDAKRSFLHATSYNERLVNEKLERFRKRMHLALLSLQDQNTIST